MIRPWHAIFLFGYLAFFFALYGHFALVEPIRSAFLRWMLWMGVAISPIIALIIWQLHKAVQEADQIEINRKQRRLRGVSNCNCD